MEEKKIVNDLPGEKTSYNPKELKKFDDITLKKWEESFFPDGKLPEENDLEYENGIDRWSL